jgi:hypothetical protein
MKLQKQSSNENGPRIVEKFHALEKMGTGCVRTGTHIAYTSVTETAGARRNEMPRIVFLLVDRPGSDKYNFTPRPFRCSPGG